MILRVALAGLLGLGLGIERELQQKTAGLRTHTLVAAGAALFTVAGASVASDGTDLTRVAAQVVTGIGFIGAGGMIRSGFTITGITTAATLWFSAAIGVAAGLGLYLTASVALVIALATTLGLTPIRRRLISRRVAQFELEYYIGQGTLTPLFESLNALAITVQDFALREQDGKRVLRCTLVGAGGESLDEIVNSLRSRHEVVRVEVHRLGKGKGDS